MTEQNNRYKTIHKSEIDSTNAYATKYMANNKAYNRVLIVADNQPEGRGQRTNKWESEANKNLTFSIIYEPTFIEACNQFLISEVISLGVCDYLSEYINEVSVKWPNDIYIKDKKVAGILIEHVIKGSVLSSSICGIGLNVNQEKFLSDAPNPISMKQSSGLDYDLDDELRKLINCIDKRYIQLEEAEFEKLGDDYHGVMYRREGYHIFKEGLDEFEAKIVCVNELGQLILENREKEQKIYNFKEIAFVV